MFSQMAPQAAAPLDLILGAGGRTSSGKAGATGGFSQLFGQSPHMTSPEMSVLPGINPDASIPTGLDVLGQTMLVLPIDLASLLGIRTENYPELVNGQSASGASDKLLAINADILAAGDGEDQTLYLRLASGENGEALAGFLPEQGKENETIIPLRLRTVEQQNGRLVADAELLSAAGKEMSVRIKLELTGNLNGDYKFSDQSAKLDAAADLITTKTGVNLPRLLGDLGVTRMVIEKNDLMERAAMPVNMMGKAALPLTISNSSSLLMESGGQKSLSGTTTGIGALNSENVDVIPVTTGNAGADSGGNSNQPGSNNRGSESDIFSLSGKSGLEQVLTGAEGARETAAQFSQTPTEASSSVRFYNLDARLDQLKRNPGQTIKVQLVPEQLGKMDLSISTHAGKVTVSMVLDSLASKNAVEKNLALLESRLAAAGIRVDNLQISVNQSTKGEAFAGYYQQQAYDNPQNRGRQRGSAYNQHRLQQFQAGDANFKQVMVNCLA